MRRARELGCDFYFVADVDNFIRPATLRELVALDLPIAAPLLRSIAPEQFYSNYHAEIDANGYYKGCDQYFWILERRVRGVVEVPVVHCTYLVRADVIPELTYEDASGRHEYVVFSDSARKADIPQYLDNRQVYGYVTFGEGEQDLPAISKALSGGKATKRRVVWHRPGAIGDVLMTLNLVNLYKRENPNDWVIYKAAPSIANMLRAVMLEAGVDEVVTTAEQVACDKQFNLIGYPRHEGYPEKPMARHLIQYFSEELRLGGRHEELKLKLPKRTIDPAYITLHASSAWSMYKNWPLDRWAWVCQELKKLGVPVVQIGGPDDQAVDGVEFNRLGLPFMESLGLLANAELHVGIDSWSNHATNIVWEGKGKVPGVIIWGSTQASAAGYPQNHNINLGLPCQPCFREDPKISSVPRGVCPNPAGQTYEKPLHACMHGISREHVLDVIVKEYANRLSARSSTISLSAACGTGDDAVSSIRQTAATSGVVGDLPIYLINLDRSTERLAKFKKCNSHLRDVIRFPAIDGRLLDKEKLIKEGLMAPDCDYKIGALGCALSHVNLWKKAADENRILTVFEDDAVATYRFQEKATQLISTLPKDWDFIQWGYNFDPLFVWVDLGFSKATLEFYAQHFQGGDKSKFQSADLSSSAVRLAHSYTTVAYSVSPKGARALLAYCLPLRSLLIPFPGTDVLAANDGIDCAMCGAYSSMQAFICIPPLVLQDDLQNSDRVAVDRKNDALRNGLIGV